MCGIGSDTRRHLWGSNASTACTAGLCLRLLGCRPAWAGFLLGVFDYTLLLIVRGLWVNFVGKCWWFVGRNIGVVGPFVGLFVGSMHWFLWVVLWVCAIGR